MTSKRSFRLVGLLLLSAVLLAVAITHFEPPASAAACPSADPPRDGYIYVGFYACGRRAEECPLKRSGADVWYHVARNKMAICPWCC